MQVQWSPHNETILASSGTDRRLHVWDLRSACLSLVSDTFGLLNKYCVQGSKNPGFFFKAQPSGFYWGFLDKQEKIGKIIQKLSNLKP